MNLITRQAGVAVPLFSLRRKGDAGCGDFASLQAFAPIAQQMGMTIIQLLPIEDTTFYGDDRDSYPYRPIASTVLNPIYIALDQLPPLQDQVLEQELRQEVQRLHQQASFSYTEVWKLKKRWLWASFNEQADASPCFTDMINRYARFSEKELGRRPLWHYWVSIRVALDLIPEEERTSLGVLSYIDYLKEIEKEHKRLFVRTSNFYIYCYMLAQRQMRQTVDTLHKHGVALMGDLPVGVDLHAADTLAYASFFDKHLCCGAPPDYFTPDGQNWGFPTYKWDMKNKCMAEWWQERFAYLDRFYDYLRVDHILGFFRMWSIPRDGRSGLLGYFIPSVHYTQQYIRSIGLGDTLRPEWIAPKEGATTIEVLWVTCLDDTYVPRFDVERALPFAQLTLEEQDQMRALCHDYYYQVNEDCWRKKGMQRLSFLKSLTTMQLCAEDLGMVPQCVYPVLEELGILKLYIERMPKSAGIEFEAAPYFSSDSVATTSTHDCEPLRLWWQIDEARSRRYYDLFLSEYGVPYSTTLSSELAEIIIRRHLESSSLLCILPIQDWLALNPHHCATVAPESERVNDPGNPNQVWSYSMPLTVEELPQEWMAQIRKMVIETNRSRD